MIIPQSARTVRQGREDGGSHVAQDGVVRNPQVSDEIRSAGAWNGRSGSYIPGPDLQIASGLRLHGEADLELDPITYQVLRGRLWNRNLEQCDVIQRVSGSVPVVYSRDFATAILTEDGDIATISPTVCFFSTLADLMVKWTLENRSVDPGISDGDVFLQNDPFIGAAQQSDTSFFSPVFWDGRLFCWVFNTLHVGDLGGVDPGGWAIHARDIFDESVTVPPIKVVEAGSTRWDAVDVFVRQSREPDGVRLNVKSALAGLSAIRTQLLEMLEEFGPARVKGTMRRMIADCSAAVAQRLEQIPDGMWSERMYVTGLIAPGQTHQEVLTFTKRGDQVVCSNAGTAPQGGPGNSTYGFLRSSVIGALATALAWDQLGCMAGVANHVMFEPEPGTRSVATWPAAVSGHLSTFITLNVASLATSRMMLCGPQELRAHAYGLGGLSLPLGDVLFGLNPDATLVTGTPNSAGGAAMGGCIGAFPFRDGVDSGGSWWLVGSSAGNVESSEETSVPIILYRRENPDSGGPGMWRGGNSLTVGWTPGKAFVAASQMTWADPHTNPASGLAGGYHGLGGNFLRLGSARVGDLMGEGVLPASRAQIEELAGPLSRLGPTELVLPLPKGDAIVVEFNGSGGYGDPITRAPERVAQDVSDGAVSARAARCHYGVVLVDGRVDEAATAAERSAIRAGRLDGASLCDGAPERRVLDGARVVVPGAGGGVDVARVADELVWTCSACGEYLGQVEENYKHAARYRNFRGPELDERMYPDAGEHGDAKIVIRQYYCRGCGALLAQEVCREADVPWHDVRLQPGSLLS